MNNILEIETEINQIKERFITELAPLKIYLFGSYAEGTASERSDLDFYIIVADDTRNVVDLTVEAYRAIREVQRRAVDIIIGTKSKFERRKNCLSIENEVMEKGVLLYGTE